MPLIQANGIGIYYEVHGQGEPLVLIAGIGSDVSDYLEVIRELAKNFKVVAFDNRGAGRSDKPDVPYSIDIMADDTAALLEALKIRQAYILGTSMGGRIAIALALQHPDLVKKLVLVSTSAKGIKSWQITAFSYVKALPFMRKKYPQPRYAFARQYAALISDDYADGLGQLEMPVAIMHGRKDTVVPPEAGRELHKRIDGSQIILFNGGHLFSFGKERGSFAEAVKRFLTLVA